mmetsp:Transcript_15768/g.17523  ORF Transcript_15768/g.17523 Transcript_15768/m.17523 type:complete len:344 (+) Transcript_15768:72-1103(+)
MTETKSDAIESKIKVNLAERVTLNVGGSKFHTTVYTLTRHPESLLYAMFKGTFPVEPNEDGEYFVDRDGTHFGYMLNYLRDGDLDLPHNEFELRQIEREARYYGLPELQNSCADFRRTLQATQIVQQHMSYVGGPGGQQSYGGSQQSQGSDSSGSVGGNAQGGAGQGLAENFGQISLGSGSGFSMSVPGPSGSGFGVYIPGPSGSGFGAYVPGPSGSGFGYAGSSFGYSTSSAHQSSNTPGIFAGSMSTQQGGSTWSPPPGSAPVQPAPYVYTETQQSQGGYSSADSASSGSTQSSSESGAHPAQVLFNPKFEGEGMDPFLPIDPYNQKTDEKKKEDIVKPKA